MLNHVRTLLLNVDAAKAPALTFFAEEAVADNYVALALPGYMTRLRAILFGESPDRYMLNYRLRQLLAIVHASPLVEHVTALDRRITYGFAKTDIADANWFAPQGVPMGDPLTATIVFQGVPSAPDTHGRMFASFVIRPVDEVVIRETPPQQQIAFDATITNGITGIGQLPGTGRSFFLNTAGASTVWYVRCLNRPQWSPGVLTANLAQVNEAALLSLFGTANVEPFRTFHAIWTQSNETPLRLSAFVLALAYRMEALRTSRG